MRNYIYDDLVRGAIERIMRLPQDVLTPKILKAKEGLETVLAETDELKLNQYYKNIEEFYSVNSKGLEYIDGFWLTTNGLGNLTAEFDIPQKPNEEKVGE